MIIHQPEIQNANGEIIISARIETKHQVNNFPQKSWFSFPDQWKPYLTDRTDAFVFGLLPVAMVLNENLMVRGITSSLLAYGLQEYQALFHLWFPKQFNKIDINFEKLQKISTLVNKNITAVGSSFSGGVDSTFTLWQHLPEHTLDAYAQITHLVFIYGLNRDYQQKENLRFASHHLGAAAERLGLEFIEATNNARDFIPWVPHLLNYQASQLGVPLVLGNLFRRFYIPAAGNPGSKLLKRGSSPLLDHFASTETMNFFYHGMTYSRVEKLKVIANWEIAKKHLRVCGNPQVPKDAYNCSACEKCTRTMILLAAIDDLSNFPTFKSYIPFKNYIMWGLNYVFDTRGVPVACRAMIKAKKYQYLPYLWLTYSIAILRAIGSTILSGKMREWVKKIFYSPTGQVNR